MQLPRDAAKISAAKYPVKPRLTLAPYPLGQQPEQVSQRGQNAEDGEGQQGAQPELLEHPNWPSVGASRLPYPSTGEEAVKHEARQGPEEGEDEPHHRQPPALQLDGFGEGPAVEQDQHPRVEEHHDPAARRRYDQQHERLGGDGQHDYRTGDDYQPGNRDVDLALRPERALAQEGHLQRVGGEPRDVVYDPDVGREEDHEAGYEEEGPEPGRYDFTEDLALGPDEVEVS